MVNELQQYIPYPSYKFLGNPGSTPGHRGENTGYWENDNRWGLMGLGGLGVYNPSTPDFLSLPQNYNANYQSTFGTNPFYNPISGNLEAPAFTPSTSDSASASVGCPGSDPGLSFGLESWYNYAMWGQNLSNIFTISDWLCYPLAMIGTVIPPVALAYLVSFLLGRGSKRGR